jgi:photosystem II stability/assembly factor-like uncharacterized protein
MAVSYEDASALIIGTPGEVYQSTDGGVHWTDITSDLPAGHLINAVAVGRNNHLWVGTTHQMNGGGGGLYHSTNGGVSWQEKNVGQAEGTEVSGIFVDSHDADTIYVGFGSPWQSGAPPTESRLFKTGDGGTTWTPLYLNVLTGNPRIIGKDTDGTLYVSSSGALGKSTDGGQNWTWLLDVTDWILDPWDIAIDPDDKQTLYLPRKTSGIAKSTDGGATWTDISQGIVATKAIHVAVPDKPGSGTVYSWLFATYAKTTDRGETWDSRNPFEHGIVHPYTDELVADPNDPETVWFVSDSGHLHKSTDGAETWQVLVNPRSGGKGFRYGSIFAIAPTPDPAIIYAAKNGFGIYKSLNKGQSWKFLLQSEVDYTYSMVVDPTNSNILYSGYTPKPFQDWAMVRKTTDGGNTWETSLTVPHSQGITSVALDPSQPGTVYAASTALSAGGGGQIYKSDNGGTSWSKLNEHFTMCTVWGQPQLILNPQVPSTAYAATWLGGTWKTTDAGNTWTLMDQAPTSSTSLSMDPSNPNVIYSADRTAPYLWKSADGGSTWTIIADFSQNRAFLVNRVVVDGSTVYVSTFGPGIHQGRLYKSIDAGLTWTDKTGTLPRSVLDIALDPSNAQIIYVTTHIHSAYKSTDGGTTWTELTHFPDIGGYDIEVDPVDPRIIYAAGLGSVTVPDWVMPGGYAFKDASGIYKSSDRGETWELILRTSNESRAIRIHPGNHNVLFAAALDDGLQVSLDGGQTWTARNDGLDIRLLTSVAFGNDKIYVGTQGAGVYSGDLNLVDGSVVWQAHRSNKPIPSVYSLQIMVDPAHSNRIYVGSNPGGLFRSDDGGATFYDKNFLTPSVVVDDPVRQGYYTFALNPANSSEVWLGTWGKGIYKSYDGMDFDIGANGSDRKMYGKHINSLLIHSDYGVVAATEEGVFQTQDGGTTWTDFSEGLDTGQVRSLSVTADGILLCGTAGYEVYSRGKDDSQWEQLEAFDNMGVIWPIWDNRPLYQFTSLLLHPTDRRIIYAGTFPAGIFKSTDGGKSWMESNVGWTFDGVFSLAFHPQNTDIVYAGTYNGLNISFDAGVHWEPFDEGWPAEQWVYSIAFNHLNPNIMYACSKNGENEGRGRDGFHGTVMKSLDGGTFWFPITTGLNVNQEFYKIIVDKFDPDILYLATQFEGVFISRDGGLFWRPWNEGLTNPVAGKNDNHVTNPMALSADGYYLYFGTFGSGVFGRLTLDLSINPGEGTIGTEITLQGRGLGLRKGKVSVGNTATKVLEWTDTSVRALLSKPLPTDTYNVTVQPKGRPPIVLDNAFTVKNPDVEGVTPPHGSVNDTITVTGRYFGSKKGKVTLDGRKCKVLGWTMNSTGGGSEIRFTVPRGLIAGSHELKVTNGVGSDTASFNID